MSDKTEIRGAVHSEQAYAQGKMLDNSSWNLPRSITPSDFDCIFDNAGRIVFVEFSSSSDEWPMLSRGQRMAYMSAIKNTDHLAVLCKHDVPKDRQINTMKDIDTFQIMLSIANDFYVLNPMPGQYWEGLIEFWFKSSSNTVIQLIKSNEATQIR